MSASALASSSATSASSRALPSRSSAAACSSASASIRAAFGVEVAERLTDLGGFDLGRRLVGGGVVELGLDARRAVVEAPS